MHLRDANNLLLELLELLVQVAALVGGVGGVGRLNGKLGHALQHDRDLLGCALSRLNHGDGIARIADGLAQTLNVLRHPSGNGQACGIVLGVVDALAG